jgi:hypothetical protein
LKDFGQKLLSEKLRLHDGSGKFTAIDVNYSNEVRQIETPHKRRDQFKKKQGSQEWNAHLFLK